ncbi:hypothetical protein GB927_021640 [Shinella sp. CPCC 100929]|uniref:Uncharacterized protein n=1 Tax=Shinella lacus TaxID=2654216 RepID=A0ABT1RC42_9HYPH|nr:YiiX/YebB-like N1pC/P60 family cysteine hydrolase [Shinella lacus]MCQ4632659.1 hypothetical protein [Shinella lacus]
MDGVQARNIQREFFEDDEKVSAFRLKTPLPAHVIAQVADYARSQIGTRYSLPEAVALVTGGPKLRTKRLFCSRLVARAYQSVGIQLVRDQDYCSPEGLRVSPLLVELALQTEVVSQEEIETMARRPNPIAMTHKAQNEVLDVARSLDPTVESFQDLARLIKDHPEWDRHIADVLQSSGYLDLWRYEVETHPWRYDHAFMATMTEPDIQQDLRAYCIGTVQEAYSGGIRFAVNLEHYRQMHQVLPRQSWQLLIRLYETLVSNDHSRREVARAWLAAAHPVDLELHMEKIGPHSDMWFSIVDRVEPRLGALARIMIENEKSALVCSSCGDEPITDYRIANAAEAMPGVPSLRLCEDCVGIRRGFGERLESLG